jgi:hypothetical protein
VTAVAAGVVAVAGTRSVLPWLTRGLTLYTLLKKRR